MFVKTVIKQGNLIMKLTKENKQKEERNIILENRLAEMNFYKTKTKLLLEDAIRDLFNLQEIERLDITDKEKQMQRNVIINKLIKQHFEQIKELDRLPNRI